jgi:hypothetical protein
MIEGIKASNEIAPPPFIKRSALTVSVSIRDLLSTPLDVITCFLCPIQSDITIKSLIFLGAT